MTSVISHLLFCAASSVGSLTGGVTASTAHRPLISGARSAASFGPAQRRADGTIQMAAIAFATDAQLTMTTAAIEQPERLPTHDNVGLAPDLNGGTGPRETCINEVMDLPSASTAMAARGGWLFDQPPSLQRFLMSRPGTNLILRLRDPIFSSAREILRLGLWRVRSGIPRTESALVTRCRPAFSPLADALSLEYSSRQL